MKTLFALLMFGQIASAQLPDLKMASGTILVAAPTAQMGPSNQGIWFFKPATKSFSLQLPVLPKDQVYEAWLVNEMTGQKISMGIFRSMGGVDSDGAGPFAGPLKLDFPPAPGSDFVTLCEDIADGAHKVAITVEPYPDSDPAPSDIVVLAVSIPKDAHVGSELTLINVAQ